MSKSKIILALAVWGILVALGTVTAYRAYVQKEADKKFEEQTQKAARDQLSPACRELLARK